MLTQTKPVYKVRTSSVFTCQNPECHRPLGDVIFSHGQSALKYYNGKATQTILRGEITCVVCGCVRRFDSYRKDE